MKNSNVNNDNKHSFFSFFNLVIFKVLILNQSYMYVKASQSNFFLTFFDYLGASWKAKINLILHFNRFNTNIFSLNLFLYKYLNLFIYSLQKNVVVNMIFELFRFDYMGLKDIFLHFYFELKFFLNFFFLIFHVRERFRSFSE